MKIVHLSTSDAKGGAARAAYRLLTGLRRLGRDSSMFVLRHSSGDPAVQAFAPSLSLGARVARRLRREFIERDLDRYRKTRPAGLEAFTDDRTEFGISVLDQLPYGNIIHLHWIAGFVDHKAFFHAVPAHTPVVWTLHDMNAFTGGCHYDDGCGKYTASCGACPQLGSERENDLSRHIWKRKRAVFDSIEPGRLHIVTPSRWLARAVTRSALLRRFPVSVIPNGLDTDVFAPRDAAGMRNTLGIPPEARVLLFAADSAVNHRKGFALLAQALEGLREQANVYLLSVGGGTSDIHTGIPHIHLGRIEHDRLLSLVYSAADVFVIPSLQDNLPNTALEAIACGTPVVGFDVGGIPDMVRPGVTGWLAPVGDVRALRQMIEQALDDHEGHRTMSAQCRAVAVQEYALDVQARRYARLYEGMLNGTAEAVSYPQPNETLSGTFASTHLT